MSSVEPLMVPIWSTDEDRPTVGTLLNCGQSKAKNLVYGGVIPSILWGGSRMVVVEDIRAYVKSLRETANA